MVFVDLKKQLHDQSSNVDSLKEVWCSYRYGQYHHVRHEAEVRVDGQRLNLKWTVAGLHYFTNTIQSSVQHGAFTLERLVPVDILYKYGGKLIKERMQRK